MANRISNFRVLQTLFLVERDGLLRQVLQVQVDNSGDARAGTIAVQMAGSTFEVKLPEIERGLGFYPLTVPEVVEPTPAKFTLTVGGEQHAYETVLSKVRHWRIHLVHFSHHDLGYTDMPEVCINQHKEYYDRIIDYCRQTDGYPEEAKFRWTCDNTWSVKYYLEDRPPEVVERFFDLVRDRRIEITAQFAAFNSALLTHEELVRSIYYAHQLAREHGFQVSSAMTTDIPGVPWGFPQVLAKSGIRYLSTAVNATYTEDGLPRAKVPRISRPFYWQAPDGSEVLVWNADPDHTYVEGLRLGFTEDYERVYERLPGYLASLEGGGYPFDAIHLRTTYRTCDNAPPCPFLPRIVREWNRKWAYPRLIMSTSTQFFRYMEETWADQFPHHSGDWTDWWVDGPGSSAYETGMNRITHERLSSAEKLSALSSLLDDDYAYPKAAIDQAYDDMMLYDEHTWGMWNCYSDPYNPTTSAHWKVKAAFAHRAATATDRLLREGLERLGRRIETGSSPGIVVFNPLSWTRSDLVRVELRDELVGPDKTFDIVSEKGESVPYQVLECHAGQGSLTVSFVADDVPAMGYKSYNLILGKRVEHGAGEVRIDGHSLENRYFRVSLDPKTGGVVSVYDKELEVELVARDSPYKLNQYIYDSGEPPSNGRFSPEGADIVPGTCGPVAGSLVAITKCRTNKHTKVWSAEGRRRELAIYGTPWIRQEVVLYDNLKRVDFINRLYKEPTLDKEGVYYSFPFHVQEGRFKLEIAGAIMSPGEQQLPDSCHDWHSVGYWLDLSNADYGVTWSSREVPVVSIGDINTGKWQSSLDLSNSTFFAYLMNNYWNCNFKEQQGGDVTFRFSLTTHGAGWTNAQAARFGWGHCTELLPIILPGGQRGDLPGTSYGFLDVDVPNVMAFTFKRAEDGDGYIIRLMELTGEYATATITLAGLEIAEAHRTNMVEQNLEKLRVAGNQIQVFLPSFGMETVRVAVRRRP